jgi:hypothetical protein
VVKGFQVLLLSNFENGRCNGLRTGIRFAYDSRALSLMGMGIGSG